MTIFVHVFITVIRKVTILTFILLYLHGQFGIQVPNNYFNCCKLIMHLQQYFNYYLTPMNGQFGIITVVYCLCYISSILAIHPWMSSTLDSEALYLSHISAPQKMTYILPNWPCRYNIWHYISYTMVCTIWNVIVHWISFESWMTFGTSLRKC